jgi:putative transposase
MKTGISQTSAASCWVGRELGISSSLGMVLSSGRDSLFAVPPGTGFPDLVARKWDTGALDAVWISDITYLRTGEGWVYLCAVRDACSRRVIGWAMDSTQTTALVERALRMAYILRGGGPAGVVFHVDRGTQYTSAQLNDVCSGLGIRQSVGRTGVCWDNAMQESFWSTLKTEFYDRRRWATRQEAIRATGRWIEEFYNRSRLHSALGYSTPVEYEQFLTMKKPQSAQAA